MDREQAQNEDPFKNEEMRQIRELLSSMRRDMEQLKTENEEMKIQMQMEAQERRAEDLLRKREMEELKTENKEMEIQQKMEALERIFKHSLREYMEGFYYCETWEPRFDDVKMDTLRHLEEFMQTLQAPEEAIERKKTILERHLDDYKERINDCHAKEKNYAMERLQNQCAGNFWRLRVEEKHGKAQEKIMTPELYKDKDVTDFLSDLLKKCKKRRWGIISGVSFLSGIFVGKGIGIGLAVGGVVVLGSAAVIGLGAGVGVVICVAAGLFVYAHWPQIKKFSSKCVAEIRELFANKHELSTADVLEGLDETVMAQHPVADNAVFIQNH